MSTDVIFILVIVVLVVLAAFLAMAETALTRANRIKVMAMEEEGRRGAGVLRRLVEHPEKFLTPVLLLLLACHLVAASLLGAVAERRFGAVGFIISIAFEVIVIFVFAEAIPKTWAVQHPERAALVVAPPVSAIVRFPIIRWMAAALIGLANVIIPGRGLRQGPYVSEEELLATVDVALEDEVIEREERALIHSIIEFGDTVVREVMVPRPDMVAVEARGSVSDVMELAASSGYSRIPVYEQGIDDIVGIAYAKDLTRALREGRADDPVRDFLRGANFVPETKRVAELMRQMQAEKYHMAIVLDEYSGTAGLVTLEDLIEELVGEIVDEYDVEEPQFELAPGGDVRVNARMPVDEVNELIHAELPEGDWDSVGGLLFNLLGHVATEGEAVEVNGHRLRAEKVQGRRIGRVRISKLSPPEAAAEG